VTHVSFVIPAFNEAALIGAAIENIRRYAPQGFDTEIVVVDNGSADATAQVARDHGAKVVVARGTVGAARNKGVAEAGGSVLVFLDADVRLTSEWASAAPVLLHEIAAGKPLISGSTVRVPENAGWIERFWFEPATRAIRAYINSGHMIIGRKLFDELGGFDTSLETGEDVDLCVRARARGAAVRDQRELATIHLGFPTRISAFARRELWHGQGDAVTLARILESKVTLTALVVAGLTLLAPVLLIAFASYVPALISLVIPWLIALAFAARRSIGLGPIGWLANTYLSFVYFMCRAAAVFIRRGGWRQGRNAASSGTSS
jgi:glycosyltransferase involved in cell wall biosynthesis